MLASRVANGLSASTGRQGRCRRQADCPGIRNFAATSSRRPHPTSRETILGLVVQETCDPAANPFASSPGTFTLPPCKTVRYSIQLAAGFHSLRHRWPGLDSRPPLLYAMSSSGPKEPFFTRCVTRLFGHPRSYRPTAQDWRRESCSSVQPLRASSGTSTNPSQ